MSNTNEGPKQMSEMTPLWFWEEQAQLYASWYPYWLSLASCGE